MTSLAHALGSRRTTRSALLTDASLIVLGSLVVAGLAQVSIRLPFTPVPVTGQTLGVLLVGASLGAARGGGSLLLYLAEGAAGLPVFAEGRSGIDFLTLADPAHTTGGYLWGFVIAAAVVGFLAQRGWDRNIGSALGAMFVGEIVIFACGIPWLAAAIGVSGEEALTLGLYPFVLGECLKLAIAAGALPGAWKLVGGGPGSPGQPRSSTRRG
jgi:biotin transport system substrate-specific component